MFFLRISSENSPIFLPCFLFFLCRIFLVCIMVAADFAEAPYGAPWCKENSALAGIADSVETGFQRHWIFPMGMEPRPATRARRLPARNACIGYANFLIPETISLFGKVYVCLRKKVIVADSDCRGIIEFFSRHGKCKG